MVLECCISYKHAKEPELRPGKMIRIVGMREDLTTIILDLQGIMRLKMFVYWIYLRSGTWSYNYEVIKLWAHRYHEIRPSTVKIEKKLTVHCQSILYQSSVRIIIWINTHLIVDDGESISKLTITHGNLKLIKTQLLRTWDALNL